VRRRLTSGLVAALVLVLLAVVGVGVTVGARWWRDSHRSDLERAASYAPADAQRLSWTDWAGVRAAVGARLDASSSAREVEKFLDEGFDRDLTSASALVESAPVLQAHFGFSPATLDWELFSQSARGAVVIARLPDDVDLDEVADRLEEAGFTRPADGVTVWEGGQELLPEIGAGVSPEVQYVALDADRHLVLTSDRSGYLAETVDALGEGELPDGMRQVVAGSGEPLSASVYDGPYTCSALAMSRADPSDAEEGAELVSRAGDVSPMTGFALSVQHDGRVRAALAFESDDQARANARSRAALAAGPAPGQGGDFGDRFAVDSATADGTLVTLDLAPRKGAFVLSDLSTGPVLFATC
jgi:hypothetical protein